MFADPRAKMMGTSLQDNYLIETEACGKVTRITPLPDAVPGSQVFGWAWDTRENNQGKGIVVTDANNRIVGWGLVGYPTDVAVALGMSRNAVYVAKCRVLKRLRHELNGMIK